MGINWFIKELGHTKILPESRKEQEKQFNA